MIKQKISKGIIYGLIVIAFLFVGLFSNFPIALGGQNEEKAYATTQTISVSTYNELTDALAVADENTVIIVEHLITLPDGAMIDGHGATVRVQAPFIDEDGKIRNDECSDYSLFSIGLTNSATIKNMIIFGGKGYNLPYDELDDNSCGAIYNRGTLTMENVTITRSYRGLVVYDGTAVLKNCNIVRNVCSFGGGILCDGGTIIMDGCSLSENYSNSTDSRGGGAMEIRNYGNLYANNTVIINNSSGEIGGAINCYGSHIWLSNCTITGNVTTHSESCFGGGIGLNSGSCYAVNTIITDNYQIGDNIKSRSDIGFFNSTTNKFINCLYGAVEKESSSYVFNTENCDQDTINSFAVKYRNDGVLMRNDDITIGFLHPIAISKTENVAALYVPVKASGLAGTGGVKTYFDYSDLNDIKMGYYDSGSVTALGGLTAPDASALVDRYYEDGTIGTRDTTSNIVIGASNSTNQNYYTVTLAKGFENGYVSGATVYGDTYLEGTNVSVQGIADNGYMLEYWVVYNVDETSVLTVNPYEFEVDKDVTLIPVFVSIPPKYSVTVTNGISNIASAEEGATVTVTSNAPQAGYEFDQWTGSGVTFANEESPITTFVMPAQAVTITATYKYSTLTGSVTINGAFKYGQTLTASVSATNNTGTLSYKWQRNDVDIAGATANTYTITADDIGTILKVVVTSDHQTGNINAATTAVLKADGGASPTGITKTDCTASENGTISGVTTAMEYKLSTATDWTPCTDSTIENLEAGTYLVRVKETATTNASEAANVAIAAYIAPEIEPAPEPETPTTEPETPAPETETTEQPQKQNLPTWVILVIVLLAAGSLGLIFLLLKAQKRKTRRKKKTTTAKPKTQTKAEVKTEIKPQAKPEVKTQTRNKKGL